MKFFDALEWSSGGDFRGYFRLVLTYHTASRSSQPMAVVKSTFDFMKQFPMFATLAPASGGSALSR
jgi:hypothetical protein